MYMRNILTVEVNESASEALSKSEGRSPSLLDSELKLPKDVSWGQAGSAIGDWLEISHELWQFRELIHQFVLRDIRIRYKQALMGFGWAVLMPVLVVAAGIIVKYAMAASSGLPLDKSSIAGMAIKALGWAFFIG